MIGAPQNRGIGQGRSPTRRPRVLVFAYAGAPDTGSEPGAGWGVIRSIAEFADCVVLSGPEHTPGIQRWIKTHADPALTFVEVSEPRGSWLAKYHRTTWFLLYLHWLDRAYEVGCELHAKAPFDVTYHATYSTYWLPTPAVKFGVPCVWGPVGGAVTTPFRLWSALGWRGVPGEVLDRVAVRTMSWLPATRRTWRKATERLVQNDATLARLPRGLRSSTRVLNHALFIEARRPAVGDPMAYCVWIGALEPRKGPRLAIHALAHAADGVRLVMIGDGPERRSLERLARRLGVRDRLEFRGRVSRERAMEELSAAAAAVFTGLREEGGIALAEAMLCGVPVIVLANGGAATIARAATDPSRVALIQPGALSVTAHRLGAAMTQFVRVPELRRDPLLDQAAARLELRAAFRSAIDRADSSAGSERT